ncbi:MAG: hypothetical protein ACRD7E_09925 [Bryobacteraceae bacterium]
MSKSAEQFVGNCVWVRSHVLDQKRIVTKLRPGGTYGHILTAVNESVWTLDVSFDSRIDDDDGEQAVYEGTDKPAEWKFQKTLRPSREKESSQILSCKQKTSGTTVIDTKVATNNNLSDVLCLDLKIE